MEIIDARVCRLCRKVRQSVGAGNDRCLSCQPKDQRADLARQTTPILAVGDGRFGLRLNEDRIETDEECPDCSNLLEIEPVHPKLSGSFGGALWICPKCGYSQPLS